MKREALLDYFVENGSRFSCRETEHQGERGLLVENLDHGTRTFFSDQAIVSGELDRLLCATHHGRNVEQITRVTGYFSKVKNWNKGKVAELTDRHRSSSLY